MSWIDGERRQRRKDVLREVRARCRALLCIERVGRDEVQPVPLQARKDVARPDPALLLHHGVDVRADRRELLVGQEAVGSGLADAAELLLLEAGDAHHEEFIEIRRDDRQELEPLEDRQRCIRRLFQDPRIELKPRELAVEEQLRIVQLGNPARPLFRRRCRFPRGWWRRRLHRRVHWTVTPVRGARPRGIEYPSGTAPSVTFMSQTRGNELGPESRGGLGPEVS